MSTALGIATSLSREEWRFIRMLREMPPGPLKSRVTALIDEIVDFADNPHCPEAQADGVPCENARTACDQCLQVIAIVELLRTGLRGR